MTRVTTNEPRMMNRVTALIATAALVTLLAPAAARAEFGIVPGSFTAGAFEEDGATPYTQAGGHPYQLTTSFTFNSAAGEPTKADENVKDVIVNLPAGLVGNPTSVPQCLPGTCTIANQVGVLYLDQDPANSTSPVWNVAPQPGEAAAFETIVINVRTHIGVRVRTGGDYGVESITRDISEKEPILPVSLTIWGVPSDPSHDAQRGAICRGGECFGGGHSFPLGLLVKPFLRVPTRCGSVDTSSLSVDSWQNPGAFFSPPPASFPALVSCDRPPFDPTLAATPATGAADTPAGLHVDLHMPQPESTNTLGEADLEKAVVTLPAGVAVNPSSANGLAACSPAQIELHGPEPAMCPDAAKIGSVEVDTPLLEHPLKGGVYVATPYDNPFDSLLAIYIALSDPERGVVVKLAGHVEADPQTGQLTTTFDENPQLPFEDFKLDFFGGPAAALRTPATCGTFTTTSDMTPWTTPEHPDATPSDSFQITEGCSAPGFGPAFSAGTVNNQAGAFSPFSVSFSRTDQDQQLSGIQITAPPGLLGKLSTVALCGEPQAALGTCSSASQIGHTTVGAGVGSSPIYLPVAGQPQNPVYLTTGYKGAPFGLSVVVPAIAGPFNLGNVIVRSAITVDPHTSQITITSDPLPTILDGIPLAVRTVNVTVDRPGFMFNPTNCNPLAISGTLTSTQGASAAVSSRFQAANCANLPFKPVFTSSTAGKTSKQNGASLKVKIASAGIGQAGIAKVDLTIPAILPSRLTTLQKACTEAQFNANPAGCPAASDIATATVRTPLLNSPLSGPVYFVSHGGAAFPDTEIVLQGEGVTLILEGHTQITKGVTYSRFETVPDAPFTSFEFNAPEGPYSIFGANGNLCQTEVRMPTTLVAQNGAVINQSTLVEPEGCPNAITLLSHKVKKRTLTLKVAVPSAGKLTATGKGLSKSSKTAKGRGILMLTLKAKGHHKLKTTVKLSFTPAKGRKMTAAVVARFRN